jgi:cytochrome P450
MSYAATITIDDLETDPFPVYARLRRETPLVEVPVANCWFATAWDDIQAINRSPNFTAASDEAPVNEAFGRPNVLTSDGPIHKALRDGLEPHYRPKPVSGYVDALVRPLAKAQLAAFLASGHDDLMAGYFEPVSALALARSLGLAEVDGPTLRRWFHGLCEGAINFERSPARAAICAETVAEIEATVAPILNRLRASPDTSPLSQMLHAGMEPGQSRPDAFVLPTIKVTLLGGMQEPGHGAGTVLAGLLANPDQMAAVRADLPLLGQAIDEGLRWVAPIGTMMRTATRDTDVNGKPVAEGTPISCILAAANRDPARFADPDRFDMFRSDAGHMSFGAGAHFCVGRWFARAQIEIALQVLFDAFPRLDLLAEPEFRGWEFRAPRSLRIDPSQARPAR